MQDTWYTMHKSSPECYNMHGTRALPNVMTCMMHDITCTRPLSNVMTCIMHDITCTRPLPNVIKCVMHDTTCRRALPNVITCTAAVLSVITCRKASQVYLGMCKLTQTCTVVLLYSYCFDGG